MDGIVSTNTMNFPSLSSVEQWYIEPHITSSKRGVTFKTSWVGIDAYRSGVAMKKGTETKWIISTKLGYTGSIDIKAWSSKFQAEFTTKYIMLISEDVECPPWWTVNWRPYILYNIENWEGIRMKVDYVMIDGRLVERTAYREVSGENKTLITKTTEVWSRENISRDTFALTPYPPTDASNIL